MGPSLLFDKSFLQSLSVDESAILDQLYQCVITPIFFVETLADIAKPPDERRPPERTVAGLAERTPVCHAAVNAGHWDIALQSLGGHNVPMDGRPAVAGGVPVQINKKSGVVFERSREAEAFERWQSGHFAEVEREFASSWRAAIAGLDLKEISRAFKAQLRREERPKSLEEARQLASELISSGGMNFRSLQLAMALLNVPLEAIPVIIRRWKLSGRKPLAEWAPFASHCLEVDLFLYVAMSNGLISDERASNLIDMAYLYYLPFCRIFASSDKLHRRVVPLFLRKDQAFTWGPDLKSDLALADAHFSGLPDKEKAKGLFLLASSPPEVATLIKAHWDTARPGWEAVREYGSGPATGAKDNEAVRKIIERITSASDAAVKVARAGRPGPLPKEPEHMIIQRHIPRRRGKWRMFSQEVEDAEDREEQDK